MLNTNHTLKLKTLLVSATFFILAFANAEEGHPESYTDIARKAAESAEDAACKAIISRETAFNALENAMAIQNDAEVYLVKAMRENNKVKIKSAKKELENASEEAEDARDITEKIINYTEDSLIAAETAKNHAKSAAEATSKKDTESVAKKAQQCSKTSAKNAAKAESLTEILKKKWLIRGTTITEPEETEVKPSSSVTNKKQ